MLWAHNLSWWLPTSYRNLGHLGSIISPFENPNMSRDQRRHFREISLPIQAAEGVSPSGTFLRPSAATAFSSRQGAWARHRSPTWKPEAYSRRLKSHTTTGGGKCPKNGWEGKQQKKDWGKSKHPRGINSKTTQNK